MQHYMENSKCTERWRKSLNSWVEKHNEYRCSHTGQEGLLNVLMSMKMAVNHIVLCYSLCVCSSATTSKNLIPVKHQSAGQNTCGGLLKLIQRLTRTPSLLQINQQNTFVCPETTNSAFCSACASSTGTNTWFGKQNSFMWQCCGHKNKCRGCAFNSFINTGPDFYPTSLIKALKSYRKEKWVSFHNEF